MTSLLYSDKEKNVYINFIDEAFLLFGVDCVIYDISSQNMYLDDRILNKGVPYKILLQEYVDTRLLSNLRWSTIDADREAMNRYEGLQVGSISAPNNNAGNWE